MVLLVQGPMMCSMIGMLEGGSSNHRTSMDDLVASSTSSGSYLKPGCGEHKDMTWRAIIKLCKMSTDSNIL